MKLIKSDQVIKREKEIERVGRDRRAERLEENFNEFGKKYISTTEIAPGHNGALARYKFCHLDRL